MKAWVSPCHLSAISYAWRLH